MGISVIINGVTYTSLRYVANDFRLDRGTVRQRFYEGLRGNDLVEKNILKARHITVHGVTYTSVKELADAYGLPRNTIQERLKRGVADDNELVAPRKHLSRLRIKREKPTKSHTVKSIEELLAEGKEV